MSKLFTRLLVCTWLALNALSLQAQCDQSGYSDLSGACAASVCSYDPFCCTDSWDGICAGEAASDAACVYCWFDCHDNDLDGYTNCDGDCDDFNEFVNPGQLEFCNGIDDDCDGWVDFFPVDGTDYYFDDDGDGFGGAYDGNYCFDPGGSVTNADDCDDTDFFVNPFAAEICGNGIDENCDGIDEVCPGACCDEAGYTGGGDCAASVCSYDSFCCADTWDALCASEAASDANCAYCICGCYDNDLDGYTNCDGDCDDFNEFVNPGAAEVCNGIDDNCDGWGDFFAVDAVDYYFDNDGDGFGGDYDGNYCDAPFGSVTNSDDCDDTDFFVNPFAAEICGNGIDDNCDGIDEICPNTCCDQTGYTGGGDCSASVCSYDSFCCADTWDALCASEAASDANCAYCICGCYDNDLDGYTNCDGDCDDFNEFVNPGQLEFCNGIDDDCDGWVDFFPVDGTDYYFDNDGDGFGGDYNGSYCDAPFGSVSNSDDCDDNDFFVNPFAAEICGNSIDDNCDGIDEVCPGACCDETGYSGGGDCAASVCSYDSFCCADTWDALCASEAASDANCAYCICGCYDNDLDGYTNCDGDCDDFNEFVNPGATEVCNGIDDNCDGWGDFFAVDAVDYYFDNDGDGFGGDYDGNYCDAPFGSVTNSDDCDDNDFFVNPFAAEICGNGIDENCDGISEDCPASCCDEAGYAGGGDCAASVCSYDPFCCSDTWDALCASEAAADANCAYCICGCYDNDLDGYTNCDGDCDDFDEFVNPGAAEYCNGLDENCNGIIDDDAADGTDYYFDFDGDGFGSDFAGYFCAPIPGIVLNFEDCDDSNEFAYPGAAEICGNGIDENCDGIDDDCVACCDVEGYTEGGDCAASVCSYDSFCCSDTWDALCASEAAADANCAYCICGCYDNDLDGYTNCDGDCDDFNELVNPGAIDICGNGIDEDCDGDDEICPGACCDEPGYAGGGDCAASVCSYDSFCCTDEWDGICAGEAAADANCIYCICGCYDNDLDGYTNCDGDCDDFNELVNPGATEICGNSIDENCDGLDEVCPETCCDEAGYAGGGECAASVCSYDPFCCSDTWDGICAGEAAADASCAYCICGCYDNDLDGYTNCDGDCDDFNELVNPGAAEYCNGLDENCNGIIDDDAADGTDYYFDFDGDGYGSDFAGYFCAPIPGIVLNFEDCDDSNEFAYPGAAEICGNGIDENCDGFDDDCVVCCDVEGYTEGGDCAASVCSYDSFCCTDTWDALCASEAAADANCTYCICGCYDNDLDGYTNCDGDCDDFDELVNPGATEVCNGIDDDCNGLTDDNAGGDIYFADADGDGFGDAGDSMISCTQPAGYVIDNTDCDDANNSIYPGAPELCNDADDNCNGAIDDNVVYSDYYADEDGDGYGDTFIGNLCDAPSDASLLDGDCDDADATVNPGASEICNDIDDDCDGLTDEGVEFLTYYSDEDGDGYGDLVLGDYCSAPSNGVLIDGDCDDTDDSIHPGAAETCNDIDDNCNGNVDEGISTQTYYADMDGDGYGEALLGDLCFEPANSSTVGGDCDDSSSSVYPGATESCNDIDDDCDGQVDENVVYVDYYADLDGDGYGSEFIGNLCIAPANSSTNNTDCDDTDAGIHPNAPEFCNGVDDDCDGVTDDNIFYSDYYADEDGDGFGGEYLGNLCVPPSDATTVSGDCNDADAAINPDATEICNNADDDCDGAVDEELVLTSYYADADSDGFGDTYMGEYCTAPAFSSAINGDCDDTDAAINPAATEVCNNADDNCDGVVDEFVQMMYYADTDGDGYGDIEGLMYSCSQPAGYVDNADDCDDTNENVNPAAEEIENDIDDNCDGEIDNSVLEISQTWTVGLYPNPVANELTVTVTGAHGVLNYAIYDAVGKVVYQSTMNASAGNTKIDCSNMAQGSYTITFVNESKQVHTRFTKL